MDFNVTLPDEKSQAARPPWGIQLLVLLRWGIQCPNVVRLQILHGRRVELEKDSTGKCVKQLAIVKCWAMNQCSRLRNWSYCMNIRRNN